MLVEVVTNMFDIKSAIEAGFPVVLQSIENII